MSKEKHEARSRKEPKQRWGEKSRKIFKFPLLPLKSICIETSFLERMPCLNQIKNSLWTLIVFTAAANAVVVVYILLCIGLNYVNRRERFSWRTLRHTRIRWNVAWLIRRWSFSTLLPARSWKSGQIRWGARRRNSGSSKEKVWCGNWVHKQFRK